MGCYKLTYWDDNKGLRKNNMPLKSGVDYYPFGLSFNQQTREETQAQRYKYNGKELQTDLDLNWMDYGARMYMADIGRFVTVDLKADVYHSQSPFVYAANDPIKLIDKNGNGPGEGPIKPLTSMGLRKLANTYNIYGNKNIGEFFERAAIKGISSGYLVAKNTRNYESPRRRLRNLNRGGKPNAVRPDMIGITKVFNLEAKRVSADRNSFYEAKATKSRLTPGYRKGQIEGMIDVLSNNMEGSKTGKGVLTLVTTSDTEVSDKLLDYATERGVSVYQITAGTNENGHIVFSNPAPLNELENNNPLTSLIQDIYNYFSNPGFKPVNPGQIARDDLDSDPTDPDPEEFNDK